MRRIDAPAPFLVWRFELDAMPDGVAVAELSDDERARAARFVFEPDRRRYLAAHSGMRRLLAAETGLASAALRFEAGRHGKPRLTAVGAPSFNLTHSGDVALLAIAPRGEIGIDAEVLREVGRAIDLAERHYTPAEQAELAAAPPARRDRAFLQVWTRKEAVLKAVGSGLTIAPESFEAGASPQPRCVDVDLGARVARVEVRTIDAAGDDLVAALAWIAAADQSPGGGV